MMNISRRRRKAARSTTDFYNVQASVLNQQQKIYIKLIQTKKKLKGDIKSHTFVILEDLRLFNTCLFKSLEQNKPQQNSTLFLPRADLAWSKLNMESAISDIY